MRGALYGAVWGACILGWTTAAGASRLEQALAEGDAGNMAAAKVQERIDAISDEADRLIAEYRQTLAETESLRVYNSQLGEIVADQEKDLESLGQQIRGVDRVEREIGPLMARMIDVFEAFVELDVPFLQKERQERVARLRALMRRSDVSLSEKYRSLMEAYQIEGDFGRTIEAYSGTLRAFGTSRTVDFLRVGRVALLYQTLDGEESGRWDPRLKRWVRLGDEYRSSIRQGLRMAKKQTAPDLLRIPVAAPVDAVAGEVEGAP